MAGQCPTDSRLGGQGLGRATTNGQGGRLPGKGRTLEHPTIPSHQYSLTTSRPLAPGQLLSCLPPAHQAAVTPPHLPLSQALHICSQLGESLAHALARPSSPFMPSTPWFLLFTSSQERGLVEGAEIYRLCQWEMRALPPPSCPPFLWSGSC